MPPTTDVSGFMNVFVHLAYGFGKNTWQAKGRAGEIVGINEDLAYGYARAEAHGCKVTYSTDHAETALGRLSRFSLRYLLGFDLVHAFKNRALIGASDVVWTHTESQYLAVLALMAFRRRRPRVIAQTVWLMDRWGRLPAWKKALFKALMRRADVLTFLSPNNLAKAQGLLPGSFTALVPFGIRNDDIKTRPPRCSDVINILSVGNDVDRDWSAIIAATADWERCRLRIASAKCRIKATRPNQHISKVSSNRELFALYEWADVVLVLVQPNDHASGLTAIQEAILQGVPVIASRFGGLQYYFKNKEVFFIEDNSAAAIRTAIEAVATDPELQNAMTMRARRLMQTSLNSEKYVLDHVILSRRVCERRTFTEQPVAEGRLMSGAAKIFHN